MKWELYNGCQPEDLGLFPSFLTDRDPDGAIAQIHKNYAHGGGWDDFKGFKLYRKDNGLAELHYPGDPPMELWARVWIRDEEVMIFDCAWVAVVHPDGFFRVSRVD